MNPKIAIVAFPWQSYAPYKFISNILEIIETISDKITLIDGNTNRINIKSKKIDIRDIGVTVHYLKDIKPLVLSIILWIIKCNLIQIKTSMELIKMRKNIDVVIFYMAYPYFILPLITSKILRKKTIELVTRSKSNLLISKIFDLQQPLFFELLDGISVESNILIKNLGLEKYQNKILPCSSRFINTSIYNIKIGINQRKNIVGYVGRLNEAKGIKKFVESIYIISEYRTDFEYLIVGSGELLDWCKIQARKLEYEHNIKLNVTGFVEEEMLPDYLNMLKLLVLPTQHSEGLPTIILESMACGTPVLATSVGAIPDVIIDGETGFLMENNSPECIAKSVLTISNNIDLDIILKNAKKKIDENFIYEKAVERWRQILKIEYIS